MRGEPLEPCSWKGGITYLAMDAGGSLRTPLVRANFAYFTRCLQTIPYWLCNETTGIPACYFWNKERAAKGSDEILSILIHYLDQPAHKRGSEHVFIEADGCGGQLWNYTAVALLNDMTHPQSMTWVTDTGKPWFIRADMVRSWVGHTFMLPDRMQGALSRAGNM